MALSAAVAVSPFFAELAADITADAELSPDEAVRMEVPAVSAAALSFVAHYIGLGDARPKPLRAGDLWEPGEVASRCAPIVAKLFQDDHQELNPTTLNDIVDVLTTADFLRIDDLVAFWANYLTGRLAAATPGEVKQWCGHQGPLTGPELDVVQTVHSMMVAQRL